MDPTSSRVLFSALKDLAYSSDGMNLYSTDAEKWAIDNLHLFAGADPSKLRSLYTELYKVAYSSDSMNLYSADAKKWVIDNLQLFIAADPSKLRSLYIELYKVAYSSDGMNLYSADAKKWVIDNLHLCLHADIQTLKRRFVELHYHAYSSSGLNLNAIQAKAWAIEKLLIESGGSMSIDVVVVSLHVTTNMIIWHIKRWANGRPFMGWAMGDGAFTAGVNPTQEIEGSEMFRTAQYAVEFAQEHGWNVISVIER